MTETGRVIAAPPRKHDCAPGWTWKTRGDGRRYGIPPASWDYPKGTVWECSCGTTWVSKGAIVPASPGFTWWRRQSRIAEAVRTAYWRFRPATSR